ncbi:hypothetical protein P4S72_10610 [Vibrio sp. PP-XX7]
MKNTDNERKSMRWIPLTLTAFIICWSTLAQGAVLSAGKTAFAYEAQHARYKPHFQHLPKHSALNSRWAKFPGSLMANCDQTRQVLI